MKNVRQTLPPDSLKAVAELLQEAVVDLADLALQSKQAHWAVVGPHFKDIHLAMDELNALCLETVDEFAERMLALGVLPLGQAGDIASSASLPVLPATFLADSDVVTQMADRVAAVVRRLRTRQERIGELDAVTEDLLIGRIQSLEMLLWMLQARES